MDFELSDDQVALSRAAAELLGAEAGRDRVRAVVDAGGGLDMRLWEAMVDQGWLGVAVAESAGGLGLGPVEQVVLLEQVGAHVAPAP
nr:acyl-CoA dehydrogenase family protein [Acidimicrobiia bacterium]